jgi:hypothetical protein
MDEMFISMFLADPLCFYLCEPFPSQWCVATLQI